MNPDALIRELTEAQQDFQKRAEGRPQAERDRLALEYRLHVREIASRMLAFLDNGKKEVR